MFLTRVLVSSVYKSPRLLLASIHNSNQIDEACRCTSGAIGVHECVVPSPLSHFLSDKSIINAGFYPFLSLVVMSILGVDMHAMIIGLGSITVSLAFMIGPATSRAVEV
jgi:hypothetical protein